MACTVSPQASHRSRPLPTIPSLITSIPSSSSPSWSRNIEDSSDHSSLFTVASVCTTLPRYSTIDFSDPEFIEQVEDWSETDITLAIDASDVDESPRASPATIDSAFLDNEPPEYSPSFTTSPEAPGSPQPARRPNFVLHKLHLGSGGHSLIGFGKLSTREPWATLKLLSRTPLPGSKKRAPRFIGGDVLRGSVDLRLDPPMNVHSIKLFLRAKLQIEEASVHYPVPSDYIFLNRSYCIYSKKTAGDPRENGQCDISKSKECDGTLQGAYSFPFSIPFPTFVEWRNPIQRKGSRDVSTVPVFPYDPPPSFREKKTGSSVVYELAFVITHGTLRTRSRSITQVTFTPKSVSPPASKKRQSAYREGAVLPGPTADPDGWHALPAVIIRGQYHGRPVEATCILYLANPLSYTRGTIIPCYTSLSCLDSGFLEALATPHTIDFRLFRNIYHSNESSAKRKGDKEAEKITTRGTRAVHIAKAVWWKPPKTETPLCLRERYLEGEVHLLRRMVPSCDFPLFNVEHTMELLPFTLFSFTQTRKLPITSITEAREPIGETYEPLVKQVIEITSFHEHGPVPVAFIPQVAGGDKEGGKNGDANYAPLLDRVEL